MAGAAGCTTKGKEIVVGSPVEDNLVTADAVATLPVTPPAALEPAPNVLAIGDSVTMTVFGRPELAGTLAVTENGTIDVPLAGSVPVVGLSAAAAAERVATAYREGEYLVDPQVNLVMIGLRSQQLTMIGEIRSPGRYPLDTRTTILDALAQAGGVTATGAERAIILRRRDGGVDRFEVDLEDLLATGSGQMVELRAGDTVIVPKAPQFYISGQIAAPKAYTLKDGMTVFDAVTVAGGVTERGSLGRIVVKRKNAEGKVKTIGVDLEDPIQPDDVINVREALF